ncbi:Sterol 3-beta-glucosyltransferase, partial [Cryomyces antarcticus]
MPPEDVPKRGLSHKLMKKRKEPRRMSVEIPDRLKDGDDAEDDVTAPKKKGGINMNKSIFGMIIEAGKSKTEVHRRFDDGPSESEGDAGEDQDSRVPKTPSSIAVTSTEERNLLWKTSSQKKASDHKLFKSLPRLHLHTHRGKRQAPVTDPMSASQILPPKPSRSSVDPNHVGALGYNNSIENEESVAQAGEQPEFGDLELATHEGGSDSALVVPRVKTSMGLSDTLMEIFQFDELEEVVSSEYNAVLKSGNLWKRGRQNPRYHRYWFTLRGDVLTYYENPAEPYFRRGDVDPRYGISASLAESKDKATESTGFTVTTQEQTYHFKADSAASAKEWVKQIQKVIFRSHNDGDSVKICLPIDNVIEIEESPVIDFADTVKIKIYQDETYAVDEYHFSFFSFAQDAMNVLKIMIDGNAAQARSANESLIPGPDSGFHTPTYKSRPHSVSREQSLHRGSDDGTPSIRENVRATLSPLSVSGRTSPRRSSEFVRSSFERSRHSLDVPRESGRSSFDRGRRGIDATSRRSPNESRRVSKSPLSPKPQDSSESAQSSTDRDTALAAAIESMDDMHASANQILTRSDVFHAPTLKHSQSHRTSAITTTGKPQEQLQNTLHSPSNDIIRTQPSARSSTEPTIHRHKLGMLHQAVNDSDEGSDLQLQKMQQSDSSSALGGLMRAGAYPLQRASGFAGFLKSRSKRMSTMLATESMGYFEKVSGMWAGGKRHYGDAEGLAPLDQVHDPDDDEDDEKHGRRFRTHFALPESEQLLATYFCYLHRVLPLYGKIYISNRTFCFRSLLYGTKTKLVVPLKDIYNVDKEKGFRFGYSGMVVVIRGHEEIFFEFGHSDVRDDCAITLLQRLEAVQHIQEP